MELEWTYHGVRKVTPRLLTGGWLNPQSYKSWVYFPNSPGYGCTKSLSPFFGDAWPWAFTRGLCRLDSWMFLSGYIMLHPSVARKISSVLQTGTLLYHPIPPCTYLILNPHYRISSIPDLDGNSPKDWCSKTIGDHNFHVKIPSIFKANVPHGC